MIAFFLFGGLSYYPDGGIDDYIDSFGTLEECQEYAVEYLKKYDINWMQIVTIRDSDYIRPYGLKVLYKANVTKESSKQGIVWMEMEDK